MFGIHAEWLMFELSLISSKYKHFLNTKVMIGIIIVVIFCKINGDLWTCYYRFNKWLINIYTTMYTAR